VYGWDPEIGLDFDRQPKWNIPDTIVIKCAVVGGAIKRAKNPSKRDGQESRHIE
jgi:hypothetical protein